jgi:two-component system chemotaxis response regulator CheY
LHEGARSAFVGEVFTKAPTVPFGWIMSDNETLRRPSAVIVDDSAVNRLLLRTTLAKCGVSTAAEGERGSEILDLYERWRPTFLFVDVVLPVVDGVTGALAVLHRHPHAVIVMCSAFPVREHIRTCLSSGVAHFLIKPITTESCVRIVHELLGRRAA